MSAQIVISRHAYAAAVFVVVLVAVAAAQVQPAKPPAGVQGPLRGGYTEAGTLPARILDFKAEPATIKPGQSATLTWAVENPRSTTISPTVGRATPRGALKVTPAATTTYTLTVTGTNGTLTKTATVTVAGTTPVAATEPGAVDLTKQPAPRTADGKPDLSGVYGYAVAPGGRGGAAPPPAPGSLPRTPTLKPG